MGRPAVPVLLGHAVFDRQDRVAVDEVHPVVDHLGRRQSATLTGEHVGAVVPQLAGRRVEREGDLFTGHAPGPLDRLEEQGHGVLVGRQVGRETALVAHGRGQTALGQHRPQGVVRLGAPAQRFRERSGAHRHDHELLEVDGVLGVRAAVEHVEHGDGQHVGVDAAESAEQGEAEVVRGRLGRRQGDGEHGVRSEAALVRGPVEVDHGEVDQPLVQRVETGDRVGDLTVDVGDGAAHAFAGVTIAAVTELHRLADSRRGTRRRDGTAASAAVEQHLRLDGRVAAGVEDLTSDHVLDGAHDIAPWVPALVRNPGPSLVLTVQLAGVMRELGADTPGR